MSVDLQQTLDLLAKHRPSGWLKASLGVLELAEDERNALASQPRVLRKLSATDHTEHDRYMEWNPTKVARYGFAFLSFPSGRSVSDIRSKVLGFARLRQYASELGPLFVFAAWSGSKQPFDMFVCLDGDWQFNQALSDAVEVAGLTLSAPQVSRAP